MGVRCSGFGVCRGLISVEIRRLLGTASKFGICSLRVGLVHALSRKV